MMRPLIGVPFFALVCACAGAPPRVEARDEKSVEYTLLEDRTLPVGVGSSAMVRALDGDDVAPEVVLVSEDPEILTVVCKRKPTAAPEGETRCAFLPHRVGLARVTALVDREVVARVAITVVDSGRAHVR